MVDCFSNEARCCCVKAEDVEVGEGRKAYIYECFRQLVREGHRENGLKEKVEFPMKTAWSSMKLYCSTFRLRHLSLRGVLFADAVSRRQNLKRIRVMES